MKIGRTTVKTSHAPLTTNYNIPSLALVRKDRGIHIFLLTGHGKSFFISHFHKKLSLNYFRINEDLIYSPFRYYYYLKSSRIVVITSTYTSSHWELEYADIISAMDNTLLL